MKRILIPVFAILFALCPLTWAQDDFDLDSLLEDFGDFDEQASAPVVEEAYAEVDVLQDDAGDAFVEETDAFIDDAGDFFAEDTFETLDAAPEAVADDFAAEDPFADFAMDEPVAETDPFADDLFADDFAEAPAPEAAADDFADFGFDDAATTDDFADDAATTDDFADDFAADDFSDDFASEEDFAEPAAAVAAAAPAVGGVVDPAIQEAARAEASREEVRRQAAAAKAAKDMEAGFNALSAGKPAEAERSFTDALTALPDRPQSRSLRENIRWGLAEAQYLQARTALQQMELPTSRKFLESALKNDPAHRGALALEKRLVKLEQDARAVKPPARQSGTVARTQEIENLYAEGRQWFALRDYDRAQVMFERVLLIDPYHKSSIRYIQRIERERAKAAELAQQTRREGMIGDVIKAWNPPLPTYVDIPTDMMGPGPIGIQTPSALLQDKMEELIIPLLEFRQANISDVVNELVKMSVDSDPEGEGVNIILNLGASAGGGASTPAAPAAGGFDDGWGSDWGDTGSDFGSVGSGDLSGGGANNITLNLRRISVYDAIKYITEVAGLKFRIEDRAVIITSLDAPVGSLITRIYPVEPSIIESVIEREESQDRNQDFTGFGVTKVVKPDIQVFFEQAGVPFPAGARCTYKNSRLIVRNTADNLEVFERILAEFNVVPSQIEIEARFIEVSQTDLDELGLQWILNDNWELATKKDGSGGRIQLDSNANGFSQGLRFFGNSTDAGVIPMASAAATGGNSLIGNILSITGVLTNPEMSVVLQAISQHGGSDLLSAPRVTARSEEPAMIQVVQEIIYPTEFTVTQPSVDGDGNVTMGPISEPGSFTTRATGVILSVTPTVGPDGYTIELVLAPEVCELIDWIQYGSVIEIPSEFGAQIWTYNMPQPLFSSRNVTTKISIWDGHTVVMGGLIREELTTIKDKVPILGDIPILGRLFRSEGQYSQKKNLMIFVTARLVDPAGRPVHADLSMPGRGMAADNSAADD